MLCKRLLVISLGLLICGLVTRPTLADESPLLEMRLAESQSKEGWTKMALPAKNKQPAKVIYVSPDIIITDADVKTAKAEVNPDNGQGQIKITLTKAGGKKMKKATAAAIRDYRAKLPKAESDPDGSPESDTSQEVPPDKVTMPETRLAVIVEGKLILAPRIISVISDQFLVTGRFTKAEAKRIANALRTKQIP